MEYNYRTQGVCSPLVTFKIEDNKVYDVRFKGGCPGNLQAISKLVEGMETTQLIEKLKGIKCGMKSTSCSDQLVKAIEQVQEELKK